MRVEIPAYTDAWMRGDRYGEVTRQYSGLITDRHGRFDRHPVYRVKLDKSGKSISVVADDCRPVD